MTALAPYHSGVDYILYCGDSRYTLQQLQPSSVGISIFSPPYYKVDGINYDTQDGNIEYSDSWENYCVAIGDVCELTLGALVDGGRLCINIDDKYTSLKTHGKNICQHTHARLIEICTSLGLEYKGNIIWQKVRSSHASGGAGMVLGSFPFPCEIPMITNYEYILIFRKLGKRRLSSEIKERSRIPRQLFNKASDGVWQIAGTKDKDHPASFPIDIPARLIQLYSFADDIVLDPFCGIGKTGIAALALGRKFIGSDISRKYLDEANVRLSIPTLGMENTLAKTVIRDKMF